MKAEEFQWIKTGREGGLAFWQAYDRSVKVDLSCSALRLGDRLILVDPILLAEPALAELVAEAAPAAIVLTSGNHERAAAWFAKHFSIPVFAHEAAAAEFSVRVDRFLDEETPVLGQIAVIELPGAASGEVALSWPEHGGVLVVGDALINLEATGFGFLPDKYCDDPKQLRRSAQKLLAAPVETVAFAHGLPMVTRAGERLKALVGNAGQE